MIPVTDNLPEKVESKEGEPIRDFYEKFKAPEVPYGILQWKGTDACIQLLCLCGSSIHFDGDFLYSYQCGYCGKVYELDIYVKLIALTPAEIAYKRKQGHNIPVLLDDERTHTVDAETVSEPKQLPGKAKT